MRIDFRPTNLMNHMVSETFNKKTNTAERIFVFDKVKKAVLRDQSDVITSKRIVQKLKETHKGWIVTDSSVYDAESSKLERKLARVIDDKEHTTLVKNYKRNGYTDSLIMRNGQKTYFTV